MILVQTSSDVVEKQAQYKTRNGSTSGSGNNIRKIRILCLILTSPSGKNKMDAINETWAKRCHKHLFIYGQTERSMEAESILYVPVLEGRKHLTGKVRHALEFAYRTYKDSFDWILKCDDDTYIIMENLRYLLSQADPKNPGYLGFHMKTGQTKRTGYMSGGAGYVISSQGLDQLIHGGFENGGCKQDGGNEDVEIGLCLAKSGVPVLNSLDTDGRESFHPESLQRHLYPPHPVWLRQYSWNQVPKFGSECCSKYSISFHRVSPEQHFLFEHLLYRTEVYGLQGDNQDIHPVFDPHLVKPAY
ncbi:glycoprotein-N-acetylgalactosamine 3-beta-galactosyltransferase 1-like isoform X2 [Mercenaria mercenaria]|nr:glycoprotein-N-acetylgalactosamine 3-beta-galactosyltransferase 1-like isoform X2 [Mercenaria mercenaria]XP_053383132.1 glycoprotein-N-acetylgalactosamine 3-beta-galactosyltransferase 1-like isoform X2 [Mercenaria mercenaria]